MNWKPNALLFLTLIFLILSCGKDLVKSEPNNDNVVLQEQYKVILEKAFGGAHDEFGNDILEMDNGDLLLIGQTYESGDGKSDVILIRINIDGEEIWKKTYGGESHDQLLGIEETEEGNFILVTSTREEGDSFLNLTKLDDKGNEIWQRKHKGLTHNVISTKDGGLAYLEKLDYPSGLLDYIFYFADVAIVKLNSNGKVEWKSTIANVNVLSNNICFLQKENGEFIISSSVFHADKPSGEFSLIRISEDGMATETNPIQIERWVGYTSLVETRLGDYVLLSTTNLLDGSLALIADLINNKGIVLNTSNIPGRIYANSLIPVGNDYLITGVQYETQTSPQMIYLGQLSEDLQFTEMYFNLPLNANYAYSAVAHENGDLSIIGYTKLIGNGYYDVYYLSLKPE